MSQPIPFTPGATVSLSGATSTSSVTLSGAGQMVRCFNSGLVPVFIRFTSSASSALTTDMPLAPGAVEVLCRGQNTIVSGITASSTATVYFTTGEGI